MDVYSLGFKSNCADAIIITKCLNTSMNQKSNFRDSPSIKKGRTCMASVPLIYPFHGDSEMEDIIDLQKPLLNIFSAHLKTQRFSSWFKHTNNLASYKPQKTLSETNKISDITLKNQKN